MDAKTDSECPPQVFISFSNADRVIAEAACKALEEEKIGCWIAPRNIPPGFSYAEGIMDGLDQCRVMVLIFSSNANSSTHVLREVERAMNRSVTVIPFRIENLPPSRGLEYFLSLPNWLDAFPKPLEPHLVTLVKAAKDALGKEMMNQTTSGILQPHARNDVHVHGSAEARREAPAGRTNVTRKRISWVRKTYDFLSGFHVATVTLLLLLALTWLATLEQIDAGLYPTLTKYFSWKSPYLIPELNGKKVPIILPGGYYVSALLLVNMILGGIIRIRKGWRQAGNLISHFGIVFMLLGGGVAHHFSERGNMAIYEGEASNVAEDYHEYVVEVAESKDGEAGKINVIRGQFLEGLTAGNPRDFRFGDLPFSLEISGYLGNCQPESELINAPRYRELVVDGYYLREIDSFVETERNVAGCYARIVKADGSKSDPFLLWGGQFHPYTATVDGRNFTIDMRKRLWPMPFEVKLDKFTADFHPGTSRPAKFISDVRRVENGREAEVRIQMNEPMRYEGFTFFQASYGPAGAKPGEDMYSVFEIVRNPADHWPEYSLYVVAIGMLVTFLTKLGGHLGAASRKRKHAA